MAASPPILCAVFKVWRGGTRSLIVFSRMLQVYYFLLPTTTGNRIAKRNKTRTKENSPYRRPARPSVSIGKGSSSYSLPGKICRWLFTSLALEFNPDNKMSKAMNHKKSKIQRFSGNKKTKPQSTKMSRASGTPNFLPSFCSYCR